MKRKENKSNRNRSLVVLLVLCAILSVTLIGCKKPAAENPAPSTPTSEVESEVVSEEVSEPVSEEPSEEVSEEVSTEVEFFNFADKYEMMAYLKKLNQTTIVDYDFTERTEQAIIPNGGKYTFEGDNNMLSVVSINKTITDIEAHNNYFYPQESAVGDGIWRLFIETTGTDMEVSFTVMYDDGTSEDFTIYVTKE